VEFLPVERKIKYIPPLEHIEKVLSAADDETRQYLITISDTMGRISEINRLTWDDVDLENGYLVLYTRKKKGGHLPPRKVPLTERLAVNLEERFQKKMSDCPWVFYTSYVDSRTKRKVVTPFRRYRRTILKTLCRKVGVKPFTFHTLRHAGASIMDNNNAPIAAIQRILGHENRTTTEIYLHTMRDAERLAISVYEDALKKSHTDSHMAGR
jgi:integrase